jgi:RNA polymerase sigma factor (sigma-70 family)
MTPQGGRRVAQNNTALTFEAFYAYWFPRGRAYVQRVFLLRYHDAEEATMDALSHLHASWGNVANPVGMFKTILRRRAVDHLRAIARRAQMEEPWAQDESDGEDGLSGTVRKLFADLRTPESEYVDAEQCRRIRDALRNLPLQQRISLSLAAEGYSTAERADIKNISEGTERSHLSRARCRFEQLLLELGVPYQRHKREISAKSTVEPAEEGEEQ